MTVFDQYHEPSHELNEETRGFVRIIASLIEEVEAINWYQLGFGFLLLFPKLKIKILGVNNNMIFL